MTRRHYESAVDDSARWDHFTPRPDDVFVCTPAKCGTTWMQSIVASLLWPVGDAPGPVLAISPWIEMKMMPAAEMGAMLAAQTHRRFMKSHTPADGIPWFDEARYVFVARDGRDAFMSFCNHAEHFQDTLRESLNATAPDGVPHLPAWDGDVHGFYERWLAEDDFIFRHVATFFRLDWKTVKDLDRACLERELGPIDLEGLEVIGLDEFALHKGHRYATVNRRAPAQARAMGRQGPRTRRHSSVLRTAGPRAL